MANPMNEQCARSLRKVRRWFVVAALSIGGTCFAQNCTFFTTGSTLTFPTLDPSVASTATAVATVLVRCTPAAVSPTWSFAGANGSAPLRMKHATTANYIPYTIVPTFLGSLGATESWRLTGTVLGANYQDARVGNYSDILTATVFP